MKCPAPVSPVEPVEADTVPLLSPKSDRYT